MISLNEPNISKKDIKSVIKTLNDNWVSSSGPIVNMFEKKICKYSSVKNAVAFVNNYKIILSRSLVIIVSTIDPDAIVFGGGVSNEIDFLDELKIMTSKYLNEKNLKTVLLKPIYGDASGVRGAALLGRQSLT